MYPTGFRARSTLLLLILGCQGCTTIARESTVYPVTWPALVPAREARCAMPNGVFENTAAMSRYEYVDDLHYPSPTLAGILGVASFAGEITHLRLETLPQGDLRVTGFGVEDEREIQLSEVVIEADQFKCGSGRSFLATDADQWGWDGLQDSYDPTLMAAYMVGTFGLVMPMSKWWNFAFAPAVDGSLALRRLNMESAVMFMMLYGRAAMDDDWFLYLPTDAGRAIERAAAVAAAEAAGAADEKVPDAVTLLPRTAVDCADPDATPSALFQSGKSAFMQKSYESALACFTAAAEHPKGGHKEAMWHLCFMYEQGWGVEQQLAAAKQWCARARLDRPTGGPAEN